MREEIIVLELAFLLLLLPEISEASPAAQPLQDGREGPTRLQAPLRCDDGSNLYESDGAPNWDCELRGCSPHEWVCWSERLDHCYDDSGDDNGVCIAKKVTPCNSRWECFKAWANCKGEYQCESTSWPGCTKGSCTTADAAPSPSSPGAVSPAAARHKIAPPGRGRRYLSGVRTRGTVGGHGSA